MKHCEVEILDAKTREKLCFLNKVEPNATIAEIKNLFTKSHPPWYAARQSLRLDPKSKSLKDEDILQNLPVGTTATLYFRDLGAQISWVTVFLTEYAGPLLTYLRFYFRVPFIYGHKCDFTSSRHTVVHLAGICHSFRYIKRLLETLFVHRFSHGTMPLSNIFKNCTYYWGFAAWMAYYINHPLYTPPTYGSQQVKLALGVFVLCQLGNFSIHIALRNLLPAGSKSRKIPYRTKNPFMWLFLLVSCPNYTYEVGSWIGFAIMTQCLPVALFSLVGFIQMTIWAKGKHRSYLKEFRDLPPPPTTLSHYPFPSLNCPLEVASPLWDYHWAASQPLILCPGIGPWTSTLPSPSSPNTDLGSVQLLSGQRAWPSLFLTQT